MSNLNTNQQQQQGQQQQQQAAGGSGSGVIKQPTPMSSLPPLEEDQNFKTAPNVMDPLLSKFGKSTPPLQPGKQQQQQQQQIGEQIGEQMGDKGHQSQTIDKRESPVTGTRSPIAGMTGMATGMPPIGSSPPSSGSGTGVTLATSSSSSSSSSAGTAAGSSSSSGSSPQLQSVKSSQATGRSIEDLLMFFARCPVEHNHPRPIIGHMHMHRAGPVLTVQQDEHITRVFAKLVSEGFLSAPVLDDHRKFIGFVDMLDITTYTVSLFEKEQLDWNQANWEGFWDRLATFRDARVKDVMSVSDWYRSNPSQAVKKGFSLLHAMEVMAREGVHRVAVLDERDQVIGISTQSMIISLISQNANLLGTAKDVQVREMHSGLCDTLLSVKDTQRAIDAFRLMADKRVSGLAVVNSNGALVDVISARDLRCMGTDGARWWRLFETVHTFKMLSRLQFPQQTPRRPLYVLADEPFTRVLEVMDDGNIHRVIEVQDMPKEMATSDMEPSLSGAVSGTMMPAYQPVHVISQRDVIRFVLKLFGMPVGSSKYGPSGGTGSGAAASSSSSPSFGGVSSSSGSVAAVSPLPSMSSSAARP